jgi:hypothetical protein
MPKFIITVCGEPKEIEEFKTKEAAEDHAEELWLDETDHDWVVEPYTKELAIEYGLEEEEDEEDDAA